MNVWQRFKEWIRGNETSTPVPPTVQDAQQVQPESDFAAVVRRAIEARRDPMRHGAELEQSVSEASLGDLTPSPTGQRPAEGENNSGQGRSRYHEYDR